MTSPTASPSLQETTPDADAGRVMQTPEIEPLTVAAEDRARNVVDLIHRAVERYPTREAMRWKLPKSKRAEGGSEEATRFTAR